MTDSNSLLAAWRALEALISTVQIAPLRDVFYADSGRFNRYSVEDKGLLFDFSRHWLTDESWTKLLNLAHASQLTERFASLCNGAVVNTTEGNPAFHVGLRDFSERPLCPNGPNVRKDIELERTRMLDLAQQLYEGRYHGSTGKTITNVVNIGIGGSDLGPRAVLDGLLPYHRKNAPTVLTLAGVDGDQAARVYAELDPERTLFLAVSKSFGTQEMRLHVERARAWLKRSLSLDQIPKHFWGITANVESAYAFGILPDQCLRLWPWVGGRYSLWSSVGLSIAIRIGKEAFEDLLKGAYAMDQHALTQPLEKNIPAVMALLGVWYRSFLNLSTHAVIPYPERLGTLVAHLQQLEMESNGKRVSESGEVLDILTSPIIWGGTGNQGQHAYFQLLHQGTQHVPIDFILEANPHHEDKALHQILIANALAQSQALMMGTSPDAALKPYQVCPGNHPSSTLFFDRLTPFNMGRLIALYEHKVAMQGILWGINSFDQWGVTLGKQIAASLESVLSGSEKAAKQDASTQGLIDFFRKNQKA
jgi:glucose-6-phosphate isomerase